MQQPPSLLLHRFTTTVHQIVNDRCGSRITAMAMDLKAKLGFDNDQIFGGQFPLAVEDDLFGLLDEYLKTPRANGLKQRVDELGKAINGTSDSNHRNGTTTGVCKQAAGWFGGRHDSVQKVVACRF